MIYYMEPVIEFPPSEGTDYTVHIERADNVIHDVQCVDEVAIVGDYILYKNKDSKVTLIPTDNILVASVVETPQCHVSS